MQDRVMLLADSSEDEFWTELEFNWESQRDVIIFYLRAKKNTKKQKRTTFCHIGAVRPLISLSAG